MDELEKKRKELEALEDDDDEDDVDEDNDDEKVKPKKEAVKKSTPMIEEAREVAKDIKKGNEERKELLDREEKMMAEKALGGLTEAGGTIKPKESTEIEYAEAYEKGEVNPFKEDGYV